MLTHFQVISVLLDLSKLHGAMVRNNETVKYMEIHHGELWHKALEECSKFKDGIECKSISPRLSEPCEFKMTYQVPSFLPTHYLVPLLVQSSLTSFR